MPPSLLPHQRQVYALAKEGSLPDTVLLWWAMGSGKTLGGLLCTAGLPSSAKVLVLCDKSLLGQWGRAVSSFAAGEHASTKHIDVKHYQTLTTDHLQPGKYDACIVDESHRFRNAFRGDAASSSSRDRGPTELPSWIGAILRCKRLVYLTGTPVVSDAEVETHALHRMLRASPSNPIDGRVFHYAPQEDAKKRHHFATVSTQIVKCPMSHAQTLKYFANKQSQFRIDLGKQAYSVHRPVRNTYNSALITMSNNPFPDSPDQSPKLAEMLRRLRSGFDARERQLVYSQRLETGILALRDAWLSMHPDTSKSVFFIDGSQDADRRHKSITSFNRGGKSPSARILFISDAAAQGVDLKEVDAVHLLEPGDRLQEERQVINRAVRFKSHKAKGAEVRVFLYCSTFSPSLASDGPLQSTADSLGMFDARSGSGFLSELRRALSRLSSSEKTTVDERTLVSRESIDRSVQSALDELRTHSYRSASKPRPSPSRPAVRILGVVPTSPPPPPAPPSASLAPPSAPPSALPPSSRRKKPPTPISTTPPPPPAPPSASRPTTLPKHKKQTPPSSSSSSTPPLPKRKPPASSIKKEDAASLARKVLRIS